MKIKGYITLICLELRLIGFKYQGSDSNNPFQQSTPTVLMFLTAIFCHVIASTAEMNSATSVIIFHVSGVVGCETLMWIFLTELLSWYIINVLVFLVASFCFNFNYKYVVRHILFGTRQNGQMPNSQTGDAQV